jgi:hypothetical protein
MASSTASYSHFRSPSGWSYCPFPCVPIRTRQPRQQSWKSRVLILKERVLSGDYKAVWQLPNIHIFITTIVTCKQLELVSLSENWAKMTRKLLFFCLKTCFRARQNKRCTQNPRCVYSQPSDGWTTIFKMSKTLFYTNSPTHLSYRTDIYSWLRLKLFTHCLTHCAVHIIKACLTIIEIEVLS